MPLTAIGKCSISASFFLLMINIWTLFSVDLTTRVWNEMTHLFETQHLPLQTLHPHSDKKFSKLLYLCFCLMIEWFSNFPSGATKATVQILTAAKQTHVHHLLNAQQWWQVLQMLLPWTQPASAMHKWLQCYKTNLMWLGFINCPHSSIFKSICLSIFPLSSSLDCVIPLSHALHSQPPQPGLLAEIFMSN